jgi:putative ABC transport system ATP-binding protein
MKIELNGITHIYKSNVEQMIFNEISGTINPSEKIGIIGPSGMGKTTLINILTGLLPPTLGGVFFDSIDITKLNDKENSKFRREKLGLIFQQSHLIEELDVSQNLRVPMRLIKMSKSKQYELVDKLLEEVGMLKFKNSNINHLSGGEQQRVSIAIALANSPEVIFADEPTGNLDKENSDKVMQLLISTCKSRGATLVISTHDQNVMNRLDKLWEIDGKKIEVKIQIKS